MQFQQKKKKKFKNSFSNFLEVYVLAKVENIFIIYLILDFIYIYIKYKIIICQKHGMELNKTKN